MQKIITASTTQAFIAKIEAIGQRYQIATQWHVRHGQNGIPGVEATATNGDVHRVELADG